MIANYCNRLPDGAGIVIAAQWLSDALPDCGLYGRSPIDRLRDLLIGSNAGEWELWTNPETGDLNVRRYGARGDATVTIGNRASFVQWYERNNA
jgi:hypothetical protein